MPIISEWLIYKRVFILHIWGTPDDSEVAQIFQHAEHYLRQGDTPMYWINDLRFMAMPGVSMGNLRQYASQISYDKLQWGVNYGLRQPGFLIYLMKMMTNVFEIKSTLVPTYDSAVAFIQSKDSTLDFSRLPEPHFDPRELEN